MALQQMMTTTKRNTSVAQHTAMIITRPGHQVSSGGQKVDLGPAKREWKTTLILKNQQVISDMLQSLTQQHTRITDTCKDVISYLVHISFFPPSNQFLLLVRNISCHSPEMTKFSVSVLSTTWYLAQRRKAQLCYPWETSSSVFTISSCIRFNFREGYYADKSTFSNSIRGGLLGAKAVPTNLQLILLQPWGEEGGFILKEYEFYCIY